MGKQATVCAPGHPLSGPGHQPELLYISAQLMCSTQGTRQQAAGGGQLPLGAECGAGTCLQRVGDLAVEHVHLAGHLRYSRSGCGCGCGRGPAGARVGVGVGMGVGEGQLKREWVWVRVWVWARAS